MQPNSRGATDQSIGKRKSLGKRRLSDQEESSSQHQQQQQQHRRQQQQQTTISELFAQNQQQRHHHRSSTELGKSNPRSISPSNKRPRLPPSPSSNQKEDLITPDKMYNFSQLGHQTDGGYAQGPSSSTSASSLSASANKSRSVNSSSVSRQSNFSPHTGPKRLIVKNLRTEPRMNPDAYLDRVWTRLDAALTAVFEDRKPEVSLEELYKGAENVCRQGRAAVLARKLQDKCREYVSGNMRQFLVAKAEGSSDVDILRAVVGASSMWRSKLVTVRCIFYYLDQSFLLHSKEEPVIREMGLSLFRSYIFSDFWLKDRILQGAYDLIEADREDSGRTVDTGLLRSTIELFHELDVYVSDFEPLLVAKSKEYFSLWAEQEASGYLATFADNSHRLIEREFNRCEFYSLNRSTKQKLSELLDQILVSDHEDNLLKQEDVVGLLRSGNKTALERLYSLLERRDWGVRLKPAFNSYIVEEGSGIIFDEEKETEMVSRLLDFKQQLDDTWAASFYRNEELGHTLRESFETFINRGKKSQSSWGTDNPKTGEMIAKYVDMLLKGGWRVLHGRKPEDVALADEDAEINRQLDRVLDLFRFVHGKAVFEAFYKNDLARRLLMGRSASDDAEKSMLARLRTECGSGFTHNLESMFKDMDVARDEMAAYSSLQRERRHRLPVDLNVSVLSSASWPTYPDFSIRIPPEVGAAINDFEQFYHTKYNGRKLSWKHQLAHCQIRAHFPKGNKELVVSSSQAVVLLLFNEVPDGGTVNYVQIQEATRLSDVELKRTLQSLACAKYRVLSKKPKGKEVNAGDEFQYNAGFSDAKMRIKINQIQLKETREENKTTHERVAADRHYETQAAIVRIMKSRKLITHAELVAEVIRATRNRGVLEPADIKRNIDKLIEKDYMEREEGNRYQYVA